MAPYSRSKIAGLFQESDAADNTYRIGKILEDMVCYLFEKVSGIAISQRNTMNTFLTEEIDVAFWNDRKQNGLYFLPHIFLVECKNWSTPVSSIEVNWFASKLESRGMDYGILVATKGITGIPEELTRAHHIISTHLAKQRRIIVITRSEIETLCGTQDLTILIKRKLCELAVAGTIFVGNSKQH